MSNQIQNFIKFELERNILSCLMLNNDLNSILKLKEYYFQIPKHREIFNDIKKLIISGKLADSISMDAQYQGKYQIEDLLKIQMCCCSDYRFETYVAELKENWAKIEFLKICNNSGDLISDETAENFLNKVSSTVLKIRHEITNKRNMTTKELLDITESEIEFKNRTEIVSYAMPKVNQHLHIFRGQTHVIAAESSVGKTALSLSFIQHQIRENIKCVFFCGESRAEEIYHRLACQYATTSFINAMSGFKFGGHQKYKEALNFYREKENNLRIFGMSDYNRTIEDIDAKLNRCSKKMSIDMVYIDYFQIHTKENSRNKKQFELYEELVQDIASLAVKYNCAVTLLSQLNRDRESDQLSLKSLRGTSMLENVPHIVSFIQYDTKQKTESMQRVKPVTFYSAKTRLISPFRICLKYDSYCGLFHNQMEDISFPWQMGKAE